MTSFLVRQIVASQYDVVRLIHTQTYGSINDAHVGSVSLLRHTLHDIGRHHATVCTPACSNIVRCRTMSVDVVNRSLSLCVQYLSIFDLLYQTLPTTTTLNCRCYRRLQMTETVYRCYVYSSITSISEHSFSLCASVRDRELTRQKRTPPPRATPRVIPTRDGVGSARWRRRVMS